MQSHNGTSTNYYTSSDFNNPDYNTIQDMKYLIGSALCCVAFYFIFPYLLVASQIFFFEFMVDAIVSSP